MKRSLMRRVSPIALGLMTLVLILPMGVAAQQPSSVVVQPLENRTGDRSLDALAETIYATVLLNLRLLAAGSDSATMAGIVSGAIERDSETSEFVISAQVRDPHSGDVLATPEVRAAGLLAVFSAADQLTDELLVVMAGRRVFYGGLLLRPETQAVLQFELNGQLIGSGGQLRLGTVAAGVYQLEVRQERLLGLETVFTTAVAVEPERETIVPIPVPLLTEAEERHFAGQDLLVRTAAVHGDDAEVMRLLDQQIADLENPLLRDTSPGYAHMHRRYQLWRRRTEVPAARWIAPDDTSLQEAIRLAGRFFHMPPVAPIFQTPPAAAVVERYVNIPIRSIRIDGDLSDWTGIRPLVTADSDGYDSQRRGEKLATEIEAVYLVQDESNYLMSFVLADGDIATSTATEPVYQIFVLVNPPTWDQLGIRVKWYSESNRWEAAVFRWSQSTGSGELLATGTARISGNALEARFPRRILDRELEAGRQYQVVVQTTTVSRATRDWRQHDQVRTNVTF